MSGGVVILGKEHELEDELAAEEGEDVVPFSTPRFKSK
jgi:hypothetical protein